MITRASAKVVRARSLKLGLLTVGIFMFATSTANGLGLRFWDDSGSTPADCDVLGPGIAQPNQAPNDQCTNNNYNVALVATNTGPVPKGTTTIHIVYDNIPLTNGSPDLSKISGGLHFDVQGDSWCPGYSGSPGINKRDAAVSGYFGRNDGSDLPNGKLNTGDQVTDFQVYNFNSGNYDLLSGLGTYRQSANQCDAATGGSYTSVVDVKDNWLQQQPGFPADTFYVQLKVDADTDNIGHGFLNQKTGACNGGNISNCTGVSNKFRVVLNTGESGSSHYDSVSGSSIASTGNDYNVTFTNADPANDTTDHNPVDALHYTGVYRFGADCSVLKNPDAWVHAILYDIDDSGAKGDIQRAILEKIVDNGNGTNELFTLKGGPGGAYIGGFGSPPAPIVGPNNLSAKGVWIDRGTSADWQPNYNDAIQVDGATNKYTTLNWHPDAGDKYKLYIFDIRSDVVDQLGAPFDSVYFNKPCEPEADPAASIAQGTLIPGGPVTGQESVTDSGFAATSDWVQNLWIDTNGDHIDNDGAANDLATPRNGTKKWPIGNSSIADIPGTVPSDAQAGTEICTSIHLTNFDPPSTSTTKDPTTGKSGYAVACKPVTIIGDKPYFSVRGGDAAAGAGFSSTGTCTTDPNADIIGSNAGSAPVLNKYAGSGSQLAALALRNIKSFASSTTQTGSILGLFSWQDSTTGGLTTAGTASKLAFANQPAPSGSYGGGLAQPNWCVPDYYGTFTGGTPLVGTTVPTGGAQGTATVYTHTGDLTLQAGNIPANGQKIILKVSGNVRIVPAGGTTAITYTGLTSVDLLPQFELLATGSISVDASITRLDGFYDAQGGSFITCADSSGNAITGPTPSNAQLCKTPLTVNGAVAAQTIIPGRTYGDWQGTYGPVSPAETFQFSPQFWLPGVSQTSGIGPWDSVTSLPPIL